MSRGFCTFQNAKVQSEGLFTAPAVVKQSRETLISIPISHLVWQELQSVPVLAKAQRKRQYAKQKKKKTTLQEPPSACEHNVTSALQGYSCPCLLRINLWVPHTPLHCKHSKAKWPLSFLRGRLADSHPLLAVSSWFLCRHTSSIIRKVHFFGAL